MPTYGDCFGRGTRQKDGRDRCPGGLDKLLAATRAEEAFRPPVERETASFVTGAVLPVDGGWTAFGAARDAPD